MKKAGLERMSDRKGDGRLHRVHTPISPFTGRADSHLDFRVWRAAARKAIMARTG